MARLTIKRVSDALKESRGMVAVTARRLGVARTTIYNFMERHPQVKEVLAEAREYTSDVAELKLFEAIQAGDPWAVQFYLKTQAKHRGYTDKVETDVTGGVTIKIVREDD